MIEALHLIAMTVFMVVLTPLLLALIPARVLSSPTSTLSKDVTGRFQFFDIVRGIAICAVVLIHVLYFYTESVVGIDERILDLINNFLRFAIAIFFITSGALLVPPAKNRTAVVHFFKDKFLRLGVPYALVVILLGVLLGTSVTQIVLNLVTGDASVPFYFIVILFQLYVLYPWLQPLAQYRSFVFGTLIFSLIFAFIPAWWEWHSVPTFFRYLFFFVWGIYMRESLLSQTTLTRWWPWLTIVALFAVTHFLSGVDNFYNFRPYYGVAVFMVLYLMVTHRIISRKIEQTFAWLGKLSLWIFLTHYTLLEYMLPWLAESTTIRGWILLGGGALLAVVGSVVFAWTARFLYEWIEKDILKNKIRPR